MFVKELSRDQIRELKECIWDWDHPDGYSASDEARIDELVSDEECFNFFKGAIFVNGKIVGKA